MARGGQPMRHIVLFACANILASAALANDSTASTAAGGLVLERTDDIDMVSEDLFVSADQVQVHYVFLNRSPRDIDTVIAFPMPDRDLAQEYGGDVAYPSAFHTSVAGQPVKAHLERKAIAKGHDYTALLTGLLSRSAPDRIDAATKAMDQLPASQKKRLVSLRLAGDEEYSYGPGPMEHHLIPLWTVKDQYWWRQRFPAGRPLFVDHRYIPGTGGSVDSTILGEVQAGDLGQGRRVTPGRVRLASCCAVRAVHIASDVLAQAGPRWRLEGARQARGGASRSTDVTRRSRS